MFFYQIGCLVKDFKPSDWMDGKDAKRQGRYTQFAMAATKMALEDSKLDTEAVDKVTKQGTETKRESSADALPLGRVGRDCSWFDWAGASQRCFGFGSSLPFLQDRKYYCM